MPKKIYNKNAREKALLEEAYSSVYNEGQFWGRDDLAKKGKEEDIARDAVRLQSPSGTSRSTLPKGDPKIEELKKQGYTEIPIEDEEDVDYLTRHILDRVKTLAGDEQLPVSPQDALDITMEEIRDSLQSYSLENIGFDDDDDGKYSREPSNIGLPGAQY